MVRVDLIPYQADKPKIQEVMESWSLRAYKQKKNYTDSPTSLQDRK